MGMTFTSTTALYDEGSGGFFCSIKDRNEEIVARVFGNSPERAERRASELLAAWTAAQAPQGERVEAAWQATEGAGAVFFVQRGDGGECYIHGAKYTGRVCSECAERPRDVEIFLRGTVRGAIAETERAERAEADRDRETGLRREAERHNCELRAALDAAPYRDEIDALAERVERAEAALRLERSTSVQRNLCSDHRDKQTFASCVVCRAERAEADLQSLRDFDRRHYLAARDSAGAKEPSTDSRAIVASRESRRNRVAPSGGDSGHSRCGGKPGEPWCARTHAGELTAGPHRWNARCPSRPCEGCPSCDCAPAPTDQCPVCQGRGEYMQVQPHGRPAAREQCERCSGTGKLAPAAGGETCKDSLQVPPNPSTSSKGSLDAPTPPNADWEDCGGLLEEILSAAMAHVAWPAGDGPLGMDTTAARWQAIVRSVGRQAARHSYKAASAARAEEVGRLREEVEIARQERNDARDESEGLSTQLEIEIAANKILRAAAGEEVARGVAILGDAVVYVDDDERRIQVRIALRGVVNWTARWDEFCALVVGQSVRILREVK